jgi:hypothetical protein
VVSLNVATYSVQLVLLCLRGNPTLLIMPKSYRKSDAIAAPNQGKNTAFLFEDQTVDSSPIIATITIAIWT